MSKKEIFLDKLNKILVKKYNWRRLSQKAGDRILRGIAWSPDLLYRYKSKLISIDINTSNAFPANGAKEIIKAKKQIKNFEFYYYIPPEYEYDQIFSECFNNGFGLIQLSNSSLSVLLDIKAKAISGKKYKQLIKKKAASEHGHVPNKLLSYVGDLDNISYRQILKDFVSKYSRLRKTKNISEEEYELVDLTIKKIFDNKRFHYSSEPYLRLKYYEPLLKGTREHYLHSFQVMLMGCVIIDKYYAEFQKYYKNVFPREKDFSIEYIWLITSIFHDIGYPSQKAGNLIGEMYGYNEDIELIGLEKIADKSDYLQAAIQLQSFIRHCCSERILNNWTPEMSEDEDSSIKDILREHLIKHRSHGVTGCFQFLVRVLRESKVVTSRPNRPLIVTHVIPAVTSIALHDSRIWKELRKHEVFPINISRFPFAVLLIFLDSIHDWKRNGSFEETAEFAIFDGFRFEDNYAEVKVRWANPEQLARKLPEYKDVMNNIKFNGIKLKLPETLLNKNV
jgi:hypothetical protein